MTFRLTKREECLAFIHFEVERMERMLDEILHFARDREDPHVGGNLQPRPGF